jgi:hypothetical protein
MAFDIEFLSSSETSSSASKTKTQSSEHSPIPLLRCCAYPSHSWKNTFAPRLLAISTVLSVEPESRTTISSAISFTLSITLFMFFSSFLLGSKQTVPSTTQNLPQQWVELLFPSYGGLLSVSGDHTHILRKLQNHPTQGFFQILQATTR